jgi:hypothetical protein
MSKHDPECGAPSMLPTWLRQTKRHPFAFNCLNAGSADLKRGKAFFRRRDVAFPVSTPREQEIQTSTVVTNSINPRTFFPGAQKVDAIDSARCTLAVIMKKIICGILVAGAMSQFANAMVPMGDTTHRHFYKNQEWIWKNEQKTQTANQSRTDEFSLFEVWYKNLASVPPVRPPLASVPPVRPPLASVPPVRPPLASVPPVRPPRS